MGLVAEDILGASLGAVQAVTEGLEAIAWVVVVVVVVVVLPMAVMTVSL